MLREALFMRFFLVDAPLLSPVMVEMGSFPHTSISALLAMKESTGKSLFMMKRAQRF